MANPVTRRTWPRRRKETMEWLIRSWAKGQLLVEDRGGGHTAQEEGSRRYNIGLVQSTQNLDIRAGHLAVSVVGRWIGGGGEICSSMNLEIANDSSRLLWSG